MCDSHGNISRSSSSGPSGTTKHGDLYAFMEIKYSFPSCKTATIDIKANTGAAQSVTYTEKGGGGGATIVKGVYIEANFEGSYTVSGNYGQEHQHAAGWTIECVCVLD